MFFLHGGTCNTLTILSHHSVSTLPSEVGSHGQALLQNSVNFMLVGLFCTSKEQNVFFPSFNQHEQIDRSSVGNLRSGQNLL